MVASSPGRPSSVPHVVVVGGGISGLAAAHALLHPGVGAGDGDGGAVGGDGGDRDGEPIVTVTVREAQRQLGGKIRTSPFAGLPAVDEGPDAFLARVPWATALADRLGMMPDMTSPAVGAAAVWWDGLHRLPEGLLLGMPTDIVALARSKLISWPGKVRAATEVLRPRTSLDGDSIGAFVRARFGDEVHERLVDPLVGSIYAADTDRFSLAAVVQIADLAAAHRSVLLAARHRPAPPAGPVFHAPRLGMAQFVSATADAVAARGGVILADAPCTSLEPDGIGWRVDGEYADAVVLACPAAQAARLVPAGSAADGLRSIGYADVVIVTVAVPLTEWPERLHGLSGYLVPKPAQHLVTAVSFASQKWAHWRTEKSMILRISLGRDGLPVMGLQDDRLVDAAIAETSEHLQVHLQPSEVRITRWERAFPQYRPHHHDHVRRIAGALPPTLVLAGASYHGIGIPACVRSGESAATTVLAAVATATRSP